MQELNHTIKYVGGSNCAFREFLLDVNGVIIESNPRCAIAPCKHSPCEFPFIDQEDCPMPGAQLNDFCDKPWALDYE